MTVKWDLIDPKQRKARAGVFVAVRLYAGRNPDIAIVIALETAKQFGWTIGSKVLAFRGRGEHQHVFRIQTAGKDDLRGTAVRTLIQSKGAGKAALWLRLRCVGAESFVCGSTEVDWRPAADMPGSAIELAMPGVKLPAADGGAAPEGRASGVNTSAERNGRGSAGIKSVRGSSAAERRSHKPEAAGSTPAPAIPAGSVIDKLYAAMLACGGTMLPSSEELARMFGYKPHTVRHALPEMKSRGLIDYPPGNLTRITIVATGEITGLSDACPRTLLDKEVESLRVPPTEDLPVMQFDDSRKAQASGRSGRMPSRNLASSPIGSSAAMAAE